MTNFRHFQTEGICRRQFRIWWKWQKLVKTGRKHRGKRRNCSLWAISPFPTVFSKDLYCRHCKKTRLVWEHLSNRTANNALCNRTKCLTLYHNWVLTNRRNLLETLWKKEQILITSIFFFFHNVYYPCGKNFNFGGTFTCIMLSANPIWFLFRKV